MAISYKFENLKYHFKENAMLYVFAVVFALVGLAVGIYISLTGYKYTALLSPADKNMFGYITGTASYSSIFYSRLYDVLICVVIIFVLTLTSYTGILAYIFLGYQMALIVLSSAALITLYGITGILNVIFLVVPINIVNIVLFAFTLAIGLERANEQRRYKLGFVASFKETNYFFKLLLSAGALFVVCLVSSFVLPLFLKSFVVINY